MATPTPLLLRKGTTSYYVHKIFRFFDPPHPPMSAFSRNLPYFVRFSRTPRSADVINESSLTTSPSLPFLYSSHDHRPHHPSFALRNSLFEFLKGGACCMRGRRRREDEVEALRHVVRAHLTLSLRHCKIMTRTPAAGAAGVI